jgi:hypothetical protein
MGCRIAWNVCSTSAQSKPRETERRRVTGLTQEADRSAGPPEVHQSFLDGSERRAIWRCAFHEAGAAGLLPVGLGFSRALVAGRRDFGGLRSIVQRLHFRPDPGPHPNE